jgi:hypothetical protein
MVARRMGHSSLIAGWGVGLARWIFLEAILAFRRIEVICLALILALRYGGIELVAADGINDQYHSLTPPCVLSEKK